MLRTRSAPFLLAACLLACVPPESGSDDEADAGESGSEGSDTSTGTTDGSTSSDTTDTTSDTDDPPSGTPGGCIDGEGQITRPYLTREAFSSIFTTHEVDGTSFDFDATPPGEETLFDTKIASNADQVDVLVQTSTYDGFENVARTHRLTFDRSNGALLSTLDIEGYFLNSPTLSPAGILVADTSNDDPPAPGVAIVDGEVIPLIDFNPEGPMSAQGWIRGYHESPGPSSHGFVAPLLGQSIELPITNAYFPPGEPERIEGMQLDPSALIVAELDQLSQFPVPELQGLELSVRQSAGRFRLIGGRDPEAPPPTPPWKPFDWTYVRLDLESGERVVLEPTLAPGVEPMSWCGELVLRDDGRIVYALRDTERAWVASWDPDNASWTEHGQAMTGVNSVSIERVVDGWWRIAAGWDENFCPIEWLPVLPDTLAGDSVQLLELDQGISEETNVTVLTRTTWTDSHDECTAWRLAEGTGVFDPVDRDQVAVPTNYFVWLE